MDTNELQPNSPPAQPEFNPDNPNQPVVFAQTNFRNENRRFGIKLDDRRRHMYVIGKTGMGKSTLLENMIIQDIQQGRGLAVVDPHGDLVEKVINFIPDNRMDDVIYFNPSDMNFPISFNILEQVEPEYRHLVSNGLVGVFKKIWADSWGPRLEYILINTILALLEYPGSTLLGVTRMLVDGAYRKRVIRRINDPVVKSFWVNEFNNYSEKFRNEAIAPIQNKVGQFLSSSLIRNIVGQPKSTLNIRDIMDNRKVLLMNLSKGRIGEENAALLGAMMITKIQLAAMSRVDIPEPERKDFYLYVDEFQNFSTESFAGILSEARKYRLDIIMAHQYIEQLSDEVRAAVFGNVGTMIAFRVGATDAEELEKEFMPPFTKEDLVTLPAFHVYLRLMIDGVASDPFSASTLPPVAGETDNREKVVHISRERYAGDKDSIEAKIMEWSNPNPDQPAAAGKEDDDDMSAKPKKKEDKKPEKEKEELVQPNQTPAGPALPPNGSVSSATPMKQPPSLPVAAVPAATSGDSPEEDELHEFKHKHISFVQPPAPLPQSAPSVQPPVAAAPAPVVRTAPQKPPAPSQAAPQRPRPTRPAQPRQQTTSSELRPPSPQPHPRTPQQPTPTQLVSRPQPQAQPARPQPPAAGPSAQSSSHGESGTSSQKKRRRRRRKNDNQPVSPSSSSAPQRSTPSPAPRPSQPRPVTPVQQNRQAGGTVSIPSTPKPVVPSQHPRPSAPSAVPPSKPNPQPLKPGEHIHPS